MGSIALTPTASISDRVYGPDSARVEWVVAAFSAPELRIQIGSGPGSASSTVFPSGLATFASQRPPYERQRLELLPLVRDFPVADSHSTTNQPGQPSQIATFEQSPFTISHLPQPVSITRVQSQGFASTDIHIDAIPSTAGRASLRNGSTAIMLLDSNLVLAAIGSAALRTSPEATVQVVEGIQNDLRGVLLGVTGPSNPNTATASSASSASSQHQRPQHFCTVL